MRGNVLAAYLDLVREGVGYVTMANGIITGVSTAANRGVAPKFTLPSGEIDPLVWRMISIEDDCITQVDPSVHHLWFAKDFKPLRDAVAAQRDRDIEVRAVTGLVEIIDRDTRQWICSLPVRGPAEADALPQFPVVEGPSVLMPDLPRALRTHAALDDDSRPILQKIVVSDGEYVSSDSYRLHQLKAVSGDSRWWDVKAAFTPLRTLSRVLSITKANAYITANDDFVQIGVGAATICEINRVSEYPKYAEIGTKSREADPIYVRADALEQAAKLLTPLVKDDSYIAQLCQDGSPDTMAVRQYDGEASFTVPVRFAGARQHIAPALINARYLQQAAAGMDKGEDIAIRVVERDPVTVDPVIFEGARFSALVMPMGVY